MKPDAAALHRRAGRDGVETLCAHYVRQSFRPHAHDGYVLGVIESGAHSVWCRGVRHDALGGTLATMNPGEAHHGGAGDAAGWVQRMVYLSEAAMRDLAEDVRDAARAAPPGFGALFRRDAAVAVGFARLHGALHAPDTALARDSALNGLAAWALARSSEAPRAPPRDAGPARLRQMLDYLRAHAAEEVPLARLAAVGGLRERHAIALFRRHLGLPPHRYQIGLRVEAAKAMLRAGAAAAESAAAAGFADQSHMGRHFRAVAGVTPGAYAAAARP